MLPSLNKGFVVVVVVVVVVEESHVNRKVLTLTFFIEVCLGLPQ